MKIVAEDRLRGLRKKKRFFFGVVLLLAMLGSAAYVYAFERGPFICNNGCAVQSPLIDAKTAAFLDSQLAAVDRIPMAMYASGTTYIICNATHCTTYRMTFSGEYVGDGRIEIEGASGGSSSSGGSGGGSSGGGGSAPGTGGVVIVGPPKKENEQ